MTKDDLDASVEIPHTRVDDVFRRRPRRVGTPVHGVRWGIRQLGITALLPMEFHGNPRVAMTNSVCILVGILRDHLGQLGQVQGIRTPRASTSRLIRPCAGCVTLK